MKQIDSQKQIKEILKRHTEKVSTLFDNIFQNREKNKEAFEAEYKEINKHMHTIRKTSGVI